MHSHFRWRNSLSLFYKCYEYLPDYDSVGSKHVVKLKITRISFGNGFYFAY